VARTLGPTGVPTPECRQKLRRTLGLEILAKIQRTGQATEPSGDPFTEPAALIA